MIVVDTGPLYALVDSNETWHPEVVRFLAASSEPLLTTPLVLAELDHLLGRRLGESVRARAMARLAAGAISVEPFDADAFRSAALVAEGYGDLPLGLTDASLVVAARRAGTERVLTLDRRHFTAVRPLDSRDGAFQLLP